jgi:hypothetical protein
VSGVGSLVDETTDVSTRCGVDEMLSDDSSLPHPRATAASEANSTKCRAFTDPELSAAIPADTAIHRTATCASTGVHLQVTAPPPDRRRASA